jgi:hypothetical protein
VTGLPDEGRATEAGLIHAGYAKVFATAPGHEATGRSLVFDALTPAQRCQLRTIPDRVLGQVNPRGTGPR